MVSQCKPGLKSSSKMRESHIRFTKISTNNLLVGLVHTGEQKIPFIHTDAKLLMETV